MFMQQRLGYIKEISYLVSSNKSLGKILVSYWIENDIINIAVFTNHIQFQKITLDNTDSITNIDIYNLTPDIVKKIQKNKMLVDKSTLVHEINTKLKRKEKLSLILKRIYKKYEHKNFNLSNYQWEKVKEIAHS